jgi:hypothetical protein
LSQGPQLSKQPSTTSTAMLAMQLQRSLSSPRWLETYRLRGSGVTPIDSKNAARLTFGEESRASEVSSDHFVAGDISQFQILTLGNGMYEGFIGLQLFQFASDSDAKMFVQQWQGKNVVMELAKNAITHTLSTLPACSQSGSDCANVSILFYAGRFVVSGGSSCSFINGCNSLSMQIAYAVRGSLI